jgi:hypothetical protein
MTIGELFVKLGFQISGQDQLEAIDKKTNQLADSSQKLAKQMAVVSAAVTIVFTKMLAASLSVAKFGATTGLSTDSLQQWEYTAAKFSVSGEEVASTFKNIQTAQAAIALGQGNIAPWQLLGIDPRQDPNEVLMQIHDRIIGMRADVARFVTSQMGIGEGMFTVLYDTNMTYGDLQKKFQQTKKNQEDILVINKALEQMGMRIEAIGGKFLIAFKDPILNAIDYVGRLIDKFANMYALYEKGDPIVKAQVETLVKLVEVISLLGAGLSALIVIGTAAGALLNLITFFQALYSLLILISPEIWPIIAGLTAIYGLYQAISKYNSAHPDGTPRPQTPMMGGAKFDSTGWWDILPKQFLPESMRYHDPYFDKPAAAGATNNNTFNIHSTDPKVAAAEVANILNVRNSGVNAQIPKRGQ